MTLTQLIRDNLAGFLRNEEGVVTVEFVIVFPVFMFMFLMTFESGMVSLRHFALERGVDLAVRDVRIGLMATPTPDSLRTRICASAGLIPDCENQLQIEMIQLNPRAWTDPSATVACIDRGAAVQPPVAFTNTANNRLLFLRACARFDPVMPTSGIGKAIVDNNTSSAAGGSYALVATSAFVVEPFRE
jgi:Flp pilus assembly protein TadG